MSNGKIIKYKVEFADEMSPFKLFALDIQEPEIYAANLNLDINEIYSMNEEDLKRRFQIIHCEDMTINSLLNDPPKMVHRSTKLYPLPANQRALLL